LPVAFEDPRTRDHVLEAYQDDKFAHLNNTLKVDCVLTFISSLAECAVDSATGQPLCDIDIGRVLVNSSTPHT